MVKRPGNKAKSEALRKIASLIEEHMTERGWSEDEEN